MCRDGVTAQTLLQWSRTLADRALGHSCRGRSTVPVSPSPSRVTNQPRACAGEQPPGTAAAGGAGSPPGSALGP